MPDSFLPSQLAPPGAGLPPVQGWFSRYLAFPLFSAAHPWGKAIELFEEEGNLILDLAIHLSPDDVAKQVLVPRLFGLEDSSRYWSVAMTLSHLMIVGELVGKTIILLSQNQIPPIKADTATVKPKEGLGLETIDSFRVFMDGFIYSLQEKVEDRDSKTTLSHPWFGELNPKQWCAMAALHQQLHRRQVEQIIKRL
ncbi:MAG: DinB family protein [Verrucomicrobiota bacterium]